MSPSEGPTASREASLRTGVVGVGSLGFHHARIARAVPDTRFEGFFDIDGERAQVTAAELGVEALPTLEALLDRVDALIVAVPTNHHEEVAVAALERGIHVLIEKPMASSVEAADRILAAAKASGALVQIGHVERFNPAIQAAEPYLAEPLFVESHRLAPFVPRSIDVAVVLDLMIHDIDLVRSLVGRPIEGIGAVGIPVLTPTVDIANARLTFQGGAVANLTASRVSLERMRKVRIFQRSGYLSLDMAAGTGEFLRLKGELPVFELEKGTGEHTGGSPSDWQGQDGGSDQHRSGLARLALDQLVERIPLRGGGVEPLRREQENFRDAARGLSAPAVSGEEGREALAVSLSIEERIRTHVAHTRSAQA